MSDTDDHDRTEELEEELRAAREVISALQRRIARADQARSLAALPVDRAIAALENTVAQRTRELQTSEAHYRALFDHSPNLAFLIDDIGIIISANAAATTLLGETVDRPLIELFEGEHRDTVEQLLTDGEGQRDELALRSRVVDINLAAVPGLGHSQVIMRDVSQRVELGRELQHARRLAAIGQLAAGVAHEINNPLAVLSLGLGELLDAGTPTQLERYQAQLRELLAHAERIARIATNLQTFAKPQPPVRARVELAELVAGARSVASQSIGELCVLTKLEPAGIAVLADRSQLEQVLVNLLTNAAHAMDPRSPAAAGSSCETERGCVEIVARTSDNRVFVEVRDSGPGIPAAMLDQLFNPFVSGTSFGTGLGLAISWALMQENDGSIRGFNRAEGGACFELELPAAPVVVAAAPPPPAKPEAPGTKLRVLCVEDEPSLRRSLVRMLGISGHEVVGVERAEQAVERLAAEPFDLVLSDVRLPGMSGEELRRHVCDHYPALAERVILMSGFFPEHRDIPHFLQKPFSMRQLAAMIEQVLYGPA